MIRQMDVTSLLTHFSEILRDNMSRVFRGFIRRILPAGFLFLIPLMTGIVWEIMESAHEVPCPEMFHFMTGIYVSCLVGAPLLLAPLIMIALCAILLLLNIEALAILQTVAIWRRGTRYPFLGEIPFIFGIILALVLGLAVWVCVLDDTLSVQDALAKSSARTTA